DFTAADRLALGRPRHDLRIVDVVLVDLFAQRVSPGDFEPFVLLVESDGALHLVATQALEIHLLIRVHRLMCLCGHGGLPFLLSSVALVELPQQSIQLLHLPPNTPVLGAAWTGSKYSKRRLNCSAKTSGRWLMNMCRDGSPPRRGETKHHGCRPPRDEEVGPRGGVSRADPTVSSGLRPSPSRPLPELPPRHSLRSAPAPRRPKPPRRPAHRGRPARARAHRRDCGRPGWRGRRRGRSRRSTCR